MRVFLPGGLGYIGSHTAVQLLEKGHDVIIMDNLYNSKKEVKDKIEKLTGKKVKLYIDDCTDENALDRVFNENEIDGVINFAGYKAVGESTKMPLNYYQNNISIAINLLKVMKKYGVSKFIFSSTASIYADEDITEQKNFSESSKVGKITNPYARSKYMIEQMLYDLYNSDNSYSICILRYFNPIGANKDGLIGDDPNGIPNNLMPYILKVATKKAPKLFVFGNDYNTHDGTGIRDYIHVEDLANAHILALEYLEKNPNKIELFNIGSGTGYSVLDIVKCFEKVNNITIPYEIVERRPGDVAYVVADPSKANDKLGFKTIKSIEDMCISSYNFAKNGD